MSGISINDLAEATPTQVYFGKPDFLGLLIAFIKFLAWAFTTHPLKSTVVTAMILAVAGYLIWCVYRWVAY